MTCHMGPDHPDAESYIESKHGTIYEMQKDHFDFDKLCIYKIKLALREKWTERVKDKGEKNLGGVVERVYRSQPEKEEENKK